MSICFNSITVYLITLSDQVINYLGLQESFPKRRALYTKITSSVIPLVLQRTSLNYQASRLPMFSKISRNRRTRPSTRRKSYITCSAPRRPTAGTAAPEFADLLSAVSDEVREISHSTFLPE